MDVHAEDEQAAGDVLQVGDQAAVPVFLGDFLLLPAGKGMGAGRHDPVAALFRDFGHHASKPGDLPPDFLNVLADLGAHFHLGLKEFRLDLVAEDPLPLLEKLGDVGGQFPRLGIDDLVFLFDSEGHFF